MRYQQTVRQPVSCKGVGLHSGCPVTLTLRPAEFDTGIVFVRKQGGQTVALRASVRNLAPAELCTAISGEGISIKTIEHVLSALVGLEVDNVFVDLDAEEVPAMDGSAADFVQLIRTAGIVGQERMQPVLKITKPIEVADGDRLIRIEPCAQPRVTCTIEYDHPLIRTQAYEYDFSVPAFEKHIAEARTFVFLNEVEGLWARGLGKGGSLANTVVLSDREVLNRSGLRFQDEFVRHKILDLLGDIALLGVPMIGHLIAHRSGHTLHVKLVESILAQPDSCVLLNVPAQQAAELSGPSNGSLSPVSHISLHTPSTL
jgi:UDP-3-O-[3-hydroxymyristoyl] N-acetylglucosamine deacetylase